MARTTKYYTDTFLERAHSCPVLSPLQLAVHLVQITVGVVPQDLQPAIKLPNCIEQMNITSQHNNNNNPACAQVQRSKVNVGIVMPH